MAAPAVSKADEKETENADTDKKEDVKKAAPKASGTRGLWALGKGRRGKRQAKEAQNSKKKKPFLVRVQTDMDELELPHNAKLIVPNKANLQTIKVAVTPDSGYWKGATYTFNFSFPDDYPIKPPKVTCDDKIYHPNIDLQGNVCLNLLKADWRPILSTQQIIHGLIFLFLEPNPADPLNVEAAEVFRNNINAFKNNVNKSLAGGYVDGTQFQKMNLKHW